MLIPVMLSGGAGTRLWPLSRGGEYLGEDDIVRFEDRYARTV